MIFTRVCTCTVQVESQIRNARQSCVTDVKVEWRSDATDDTTLEQAPRVLTSLFYAQQLVVYGFVENCTQVNVVLKSLLRNSTYS